MDSIFDHSPTEEQAQANKHKELLRRLLEVLFGVQIGSAGGGEKLTEKEVRQALADAHAIAQDVRSGASKVDHGDRLEGILAQLTAKLRELNPAKTQELERAVRELSGRLQQLKPASVEAALSELNASVKAIKPSDSAGLERAVRDLNTTLRQVKAGDADKALKERIDAAAKSEQAVRKALAADLKARTAEIAKLEKALDALKRDREKDQQELNARALALADANGKLSAVHLKPPETLKEALIPTFLVYIDSRDEVGQIKTARLVPANTSKMAPQVGPIH